MSRTSTARTTTTSWKAASRASPAPCARRSRSTPASRMRSLPPRACWGVHCDAAVAKPEPGSLSPSPGTGEGNAACVLARSHAPPPRSPKLTGPIDMQIAIVDYGAGNLRSAEKALAAAAEHSGRADARVVVTADPDTVRNADRVVLPGVGAFADCKRGLDSLAGMVEAMEEAVLKDGKPFLGICVGMQLMA